MWTAWLSVPLGLAVVGVAAWLLTTYAHLPIVATWLVFVAVGWVLYRNAKASVAGVALCVAAVAVAITGYGLTALFGDPEGRIASFLGVLAGIMYLLGGLVFFIASLRNRTRCAGNCAGFMIVFFSIVISAMSACTQRDYRAGPQAIQETRELILTLHRLSAEIDAARAKTGRLPKDEAELVTLRGKPLPTHSSNYHVRYLQDNDGGYYLEGYVTYLWGGGWGWVYCFYGSDAAQRLHVESF